MYPPNPSHLSPALGTIAVHPWESHHIRVCESTELVTPVELHQWRSEFFKCGVGMAILCGSGVHFLGDGLNKRAWIEKKTVPVAEKPSDHPQASCVLSAVIRSSVTDVSPPCGRGSSSGLQVFPGGREPIYPSLMARYRPRTKPVSVNQSKSVAKFGPLPKMCLAYGDGTTPKRTDG